MKKKYEVPTISVQEMDVSYDVLTTSVAYDKELIGKDQQDWFGGLEG